MPWKQNVSLQFCHLYWFDLPGFVKNTVSFRGLSGRRVLGIISCMGEISKAKVPQNDRKLTKDWGREIKLGSGVFSIYRFNKREAITGRHPGFIEYAKSTTKFCTKSSYEGNYNSLGFAGYGEYVYPHGVKYEGHFKDGVFHGRGSLIYPLGQTVEGIWKHGKLISYTFKSTDGLEYSSPWKYCQPPDRRFQSEKLDGLHAAGEEYLTNKQPSKSLKPCCYDTVDGYFDPKQKCIYKDEVLYVKDKNKTYCCRQEPDILRVCTKKEEELIKENYRKAEDETIGYCPALYEMWTTGKQSDVEAIKKKLKKIPSQLMGNLSATDVLSMPSTSSDSTV